MPIDTQPVVAATVMDRSKPLGNSEGDDDRGRLHVKISNKSSEPVSVVVAGEDTAGTPFYLDYDDTASGNSPITILTTTVPALTILSLSQLKIVCRLESTIRVELNGDLIGSLSTGSGQPSDEIYWTPIRPCVAGDVIEVKLTKRAGSPDVDVGAHLMGSTKPTT